MATPAPSPLVSSAATITRAGRVIIHSAVMAPVSPGEGESTAHQVGQYLADFFTAHDDDQ